MAGCAVFRWLHLPVLLELAAHFELGHLLAESDGGQRDELFNGGSFAAFLDGFSDLARLDRKSVV